MMPLGGAPYKKEVERMTELIAAAKEVLGLAIMPDAAAAYAFWDAAVERLRQAVLEAER